MSGKVKQRTRGGAESSAKVKAIERTTAGKRVAAKKEKIKEIPRVQLKPQGEPPRAVVVKRHRSVLGQRVGKGFSRGELKAAGLSVDQALRYKLRVDSRRNTVHPWNVKALRQYLGVETEGS